MLWGWAAPQLCRLGETCPELTGGCWGHTASTTGNATMPAPPWAQLWHLPHQHCSLPAAEPILLALSVFPLPGEPGAAGEVLSPRKHPEWVPLCPEITTSEGLPAPSAHRGCFLPPHMKVWVLPASWLSQPRLLLPSPATRNRVFFLRYETTGRKGSPGCSNSLTRVKSGRTRGRLRQPGEEAMLT